MGQKLKQKQIEEMDARMYMQKATLPKEEEFVAINMKSEVNDGN